MWVQKKPNGKFQFFERFPMPGRRYKTYSVTMDRNNAQTRKLAGQLLQAKAGRWTDKDFTIGEVQAAYYEEQKKTVRLQTAERNRSTLKNMVKLIGPKVKANDITAAHIRKILLQQDKTEGWRNEYITRFKAMMRWAYINDFVDNTRCIDKLKLFALPVSAKTKIDNKYLTTDELKAVISALDDKPAYQLVVKFLALTGLRFGEFAALLPEDVTADTIKITKTFNEAYKVTNETKTYQSSREISVQPELQPIIRDIRLLVKRESLKDPRIKEYPYFFPNIFGNRGKCGRGHLSIYSFDKMFKKLTTDTVGKELTSHALRHTHASLLFQEGFTYDQVGRRLGHGGDSRITRQIYVHITSRLKEKDAKELSKITLLG